MEIQFQGQLTRAIIVADKLDPRIVRYHLTRLVETMQDVVSKPGRSAPGKPPGLQTGRLRDSIKLYDRSRGNEYVFQVAIEAPYAEYLEWGTKRMAPRPFMLKTYNQFKTLSISQIIKDLMKHFRPRFRKAP